MRTLTYDRSARGRTSLHSPGSILTERHVAAISDAKTQTDTAFDQHSTYIHRAMPIPCCRNTTGLDALLLFLANRGSYSNDHAVANGQKTTPRLILRWGGFSRDTIP